MLYLNYKFRLSQTLFLSLILLFSTFNILLPCAFEDHKDIPLSVRGLDLALPGQVTSRPYNGKVSCLKCFDAKHAPHGSFANSAPDLQSSISQENQQFLLQFLNAGEDWRRMAQLSRINRYWALERLSYPLGPDLALAYEHIVRGTSQYTEGVLRYLSSFHPPSQYRAAKYFSFSPLMVHAAYSGHIPAQLECGLVAYKASNCDWAHYFFNMASQPRSFSFYSGDKLVRFVYTTALFDFVLQKRKEGNNADADILLNEFTTRLPQLFKITLKQGIDAQKYEATSHLIEAGFGNKRLNITDPEIVEYIKKFCSEQSETLQSRARSFLKTPGGKPSELIEGVKNFIAKTSKYDPDNAQQYITDVLTSLEPLSPKISSIAEYLEVEYAERDPQKSKKCALDAILGGKYGGGKLPADKLYHACTNKKDSSHAKLAFEELTCRAVQKKEPDAILRYCQCHLKQKTFNIDDAHLLRELQLQEHYSYFVEHIYPDLKDFLTDSHPELCGLVGSQLCRYALTNSSYYAMAEQCLALALQHNIPHVEQDWILAALQSDNKVKQNDAIQRAGEIMEFSAQRKTILVDCGIDWLRAAFERLKTLVNSNNAAALHCAFAHIWGIDGVVAIDLAEAERLLQKPLQQKSPQPKTFILQAHICLKQNKPLYAAIYAYKACKILSSQTRSKEYNSILFDANSIINVLLAEKKMSDIFAYAVVVKHDNDRPDEALDCFGQFLNSGNVFEFSEIMHVVNAVQEITIKNKSAKGHFLLSCYFESSVPIIEEIPLKLQQLLVARKHLAQAMQDSAYKGQEYQEKYGRICEAVGSAFIILGNPQDAKKIFEEALCYADEKTAQRLKKAYDILTPNKGAYERISQKLKEYGASLSADNKNSFNNLVDAFAASRYDQVLTMAQALPSLPVIKVMRACSLAVKNRNDQDYQKAESQVFSELSEFLKTQVINPDPFDVLVDLACEGLEELKKNQNVAAAYCVAAFMNQRFLVNINTSNFSQWKSYMLKATAKSCEVEKMALYSKNPQDLQKLFTSGLWDTEGKLAEKYPGSALGTFNFLLACTTQLANRCNKIILPPNIIQDYKNRMERLITGPGKYLVDQSFQSANAKVLVNQQEYQEYAGVCEEFATQLKILHAKYPNDVTYARNFAIMLNLCAYIKQVCQGPRTGAVLHNADLCRQLLTQGAERDDACSQFYLGKIYQAVGQPQQAVKLFGRSSAGGYKDAYHFYALALQKANDNEKAVRFFVKSCEENTRFALASRVWLVYLCAQKDDRQTFEHLHALSTGLQQMQDPIAFATLCDIPDLCNAVAGCAESLEPENPNRGLLYLNLGQICYLASKYAPFSVEEKKYYMTKAKHCFAKSSEYGAVCNLVIFFEQQQDWKEAVNVLHNAFKKYEQNREELGPLLKVLDSLQRLISGSNSPEMEKSILINILMSLQQHYQQ